MVFRASDECCVLYYAMFNRILFIQTQMNKWQKERRNSLQVLIPPSIISQHSYSDASNSSTTLHNISQLDRRLRIRLHLLSDMSPLLQSIRHTNQLCLRKSIAQECKAKWNIRSCCRNIEGIDPDSRVRRVCAHGHSDDGCSNDSCEARRKQCRQDDGIEVVALNGAEKCCVTAKIEIGLVGVPEADVVVTVAER